MGSATRPQPFPSDAELLASARAGDRASLGALLERHRARLLAVALSFLGNRPEAQDAVHDAFLTALFRLGEVRDAAAVGRWLAAIVRSRCLMELRRRRTHAAAVPPGEAERVAAAQAAVERHALRDWLWTALGGLSEPLRIAVMLRYFGSYGSYQELAAILGVPVGTVRSRLAEAKHRLGELLLEGATAADPDGRARVDERRRTLLESFRDIYRRARGRDAFLSRFADDVRIVLSSGAFAVGRSHLAAEIDGDTAAGVRFEPERVLASGRVAVVEGRFENPPEDPHHCPPGASMVLFGHEDRLERLHLHLSPRPPLDG